MVNHLLIICGYMNSLDIVNISYGVSVCIGILVFAHSKMLDIRNVLTCGNQTREFHMYLHYSVPYEEFLLEAHVALYAYVYVNVETRKRYFF